MRILQLTPDYFPVIGGVERHVQALSERLVARGHEVTVATMQPRGRRLAHDTFGDGPLASEAHAGVAIQRFSAVGVGDAYRVPPGLLGFLRDTRNSWDVIHVHNYHAALIPLVALSGVRPFVVTTHLNDTPHSAAARVLHVPYSAIGRWALRQAQAVICVTEAERERVQERLWVEPRRTIVIPNGVNEAIVAANTANVGTDSASTEHDPFLLLSVGRLQPYKRVEDGIAILAELEARYRLAVVGDGPHRGLLEQRAVALGVRDRVDFVGQVRDEELIGWYGRAGVVLSLSEAEAFGMTVLEGVAAGCQVICSDIPAFRDLARYFPERVSVLVGRDARAGAEAVRQARGRLAQERIRSVPPDISGFTWDAVAERVVDVYRQVTGIVTETLDAAHQAAAQHPTDVHPPDVHPLAEG